MLIPSSATGTPGSMAFSLAATLYLGIRDMNHKVWKTV